MGTIVQLQSQNEFILSLGITGVDNTTNNIFA